MNITTTAQQIINSTAQDIRNLLDGNGTDSAILLDYVNRTHMDLLRASRWEFLASTPQRFVTQPGVTDYWIGATGSAPSGTFDTGLNLSDLEFIRRDSVWDRTNNRNLERTLYIPTASSIEFPDGSIRAGRPERYRHQYATPNILSIYPAPDNENGFQPQPGTPMLAVKSGGTLPARTYYVKQTFVDSAGNESQASSVEASIFIPANFLLQVNPSQPAISESANGTLYNQYKVYASSVSNGETFQAGPIALSASWTEPTSGLTTNGASFPTASTLTPLLGYVIEFTYYKQRKQILDGTNVLQIPDDYFDVIVAGVNALAYTYLVDNMEMMQTWGALYGKGKVDMIRDKNMFPGGSEFLRPDNAAMANQSLIATDLLYIYGIPT